MCHEGAPGHVMQGDIRVRQQGAPQFRLAARNAAFNEGWGLYSELLCKEMGVYPDIASDFMRLDAELFRAARLVTDTGLHAKGWTRDQAIAYLKATGRRGEDQARAETRRYIVNPGQATAYKIGMIRILQLRDQAQKALGPKFDLKAFNDTVIASGSLPLSWCWSSGSRIGAPSGRRPRTTDAERGGGRNSVSSPAITSSISSSPLGRADRRRLRRRRGRRPRRRG